MISQFICFNESGLQPPSKPFRSVAIRYRKYRDGLVAAIPTKRG